MNNDFHSPRTIFDLLKNITVPDLDKEVVVAADHGPETNGINGTSVTTNGTHTAAPTVAAAVAA